MSVLLGNDDGTFQNQQASVVVGDLNGDAIPNLVTANLFSKKVFKRVTGYRCKLSVIFLKLAHEPNK